MAQPASIRMNLNTREFEASGSEEFVVDRLREFLDRFDNLAAESRSEGNVIPESGASRLSPRDARLEMPSEFGEFLQRFNDDLSDTDRMLVASYFSQEQTDDRGFTTRDANQLLLEQGYRLSNPSECNRRNVASKRVFALAGGRKYRVSQAGIDHVVGLLRNGHQ